MAKDPAFLFYPGDYLRDTQTLSEKTQVAYDRIMCEHMRNICISKQQLKFFTKRLSEEEISELMFVLTEKNGSFQISWVAESIEKRLKYSDSRRKNRSKNQKKEGEDMNNISKTYVEHMENENENENENINGSVIEIKNMIASWFEFYENRTGLKPKYGTVEGAKMKSIHKYLAQVIKDNGSDNQPADLFKAILDNWEKIGDKWIRENALDLKIFESKINIIINGIKRKVDKTQQFRSRVEKYQ